MAATPSAVATAISTVATTTLNTDVTSTVTATAIIIELNQKNLCTSGLSKWYGSNNLEP